MVGPAMVPPGNAMSAPALKTTDLSRELSQPSGNRQALFEQYVVKGAAAKSLQIHLVFIIPELIQNVC